MTKTLAAMPSHYRVLIVDDEKQICKLLESALKNKYDVTLANSGEEAIEKIESTTFDVVVTDLKLPGKTGIDVLEKAKGRDLRTEVIIITGYASLDSATSAINHGAASYLIKPVSIANFIMHTDKAIASRDFYLKTAMLMEHSKGMQDIVKDHITNITEIYEFSRKVMLTLDVQEIVSMFLGEINKRLNAAFSVLATSVFGATEIYLKAQNGQLDKDAGREVILKHWDTSFGVLDKETMHHEHASFVVLSSESGSSAVVEPIDTEPFSTPMIIMGKTIGTVAVFRPHAQPLSPGESQLIYILTTIVGPLMEHGYTHRKARLLADTDPLTGVANHRSFHEILSREIARANRHGTEFSLLLLDIDDFKKVNDTFGHLVGDAVLKDLTQRIAGSIRLNDVLARYGGEEFVVILPDTDIRGTRVQAERIRNVICSQPFVFPDNEIPYTISIGIAMYSGEQPRERESLIRDADDALYVSKNQGKNCVNER